MKTTTLAILAVALAALAPFALAAEGDSDRDPNAGVRQPTMRELENKIDQAVREIRGVLAAVGPLATATAVDALTTEVRTNHTTIVGKFAPQMAVVMTVPPWWSGFTSASDSANMSVGNPRHYLVGESTIPGFPAGTVGADGLFTDRTLPAGTYLFELQQPYGDNTICQSELSRRFLRGTNTGERYVAACPRVRLHPFSLTARDSTRLEDGYGIYTYAAPASFQLRHKWPSGLKFSEDTRLSATDRANAKPMSSYTGAVRITKLK